MLFEKSIKTNKRNELLDITNEVKRAVKDSGIKEGICIIFVEHTTAGLTINENADPDVKRDIITFFEKNVPVNFGFFHSEGNSDSHIKSTIFSPSLTLIIHNSELVLGTWQGIYFCEFDGPRTRRYYIKCISD
ncbi:MAG: secondary thiamine-phosphate synthase enzyme YjbQ [Brevinematia bacterium]